MPASDSEPRHSPSRFDPHTRPEDVPGYVPETPPHLNQVELQEKIAQATRATWEHKPLWRALGTTRRRLHQEMRLLMGDLSIGVTANDLNHPDVEEIFTSLQELGFVVVNPADVFGVLAYLLEERGLELPAGKKQKQVRGEIISRLLNELLINFDTDQGRLQLADSQGEPTLDLVAHWHTQEEHLQPLIALLTQDNMVYGQVLQFTKDITANQPRLAVGQTSPRQIGGLGPRIYSADNSSRDIQKGGDYAVKPEATKFGALREIVTHITYSERRQELQQAIEHNEVVLYPKFDLENWPSHPLTTHLKHQVAPVIEQFLEEHSLVADPRDLLYQTLFRLTTLDLSQVFYQGAALEHYLRQAGAYTNWRNILELDPEIITQFQINQSVVTAIIEEQFQVIENRLANSKLPLEWLLTPHGIFAEEGWVVSFQGGQVFATQEDDPSQKIPLEFRPIPPELAIEYHRDLHYIHSPRAVMAFGLFLEGDEWPFSVISLDEIRKPFKQNTLLMNGYDPRKCYDLTRLWSKPGTPGNTSSAMFSLVTAYLKEHQPETQAMLSAFMPTYASGVSMTSGGFDNPVILVPQTHVFAETKLGMEHLVYDRQVNLDAERHYHQWPLFPTVELLSTLQAPRFEPLPQMQNTMVEFV